MSSENLKKFLFPSLNKKLMDELTKCDTSEKSLPFEMRFKKINLQKIKEKNSNLPLKPCMRCSDYVNYPSHSQKECALFDHLKRFSSEENSSEENKTEEEEDNCWREKNNKFTGASSFRTNDNRILRQKLRKSPYEQQVIHTSKSPSFSSPSYNIFKWNQADTNITYHSPSITEKNDFNNISTFLKRQKRRTICIEGNLASGKTTLLQELKKMGDFNIQTFREPLEKWTDVHGENLLDMLYTQPEKHAATFQSYAMLTMAQIHNTPSTNFLKIMERSIYSSRFVFLETQKERGNINNTDHLILHNWFEFAIHQSKIITDAIIYLRTDPQTAFKRLQKRNRAEEANVNLEYITQIHSKYEDWLVKGKFSWPCQIIIINANKPMNEILHQLNTEVTLIP